MKKKHIQEVIQNILQIYWMKKIVIALIGICICTSFQIKVDPEQCIEEKCPKQAAECKKDPKCAPTLQACEKECGDKESCWKWCLVKKGDTAAEDVAKCAAQNHCLGEEEIEIVEMSTELAEVDPEQCIEEKCPKQAAECKKDPKCAPTLQACEKECGDKESCWKWCLVKKGDTAAEDVAKCAAQNHCLGEEEIEIVEMSTELAEVDPEQCIEEKCPKQAAECKKDPKCAPTLQACEKECGDKESCWKWCLVKKGDTAAEDVAKCAAQNHCLGESPHSFQICMHFSCSSSEQKCFNDYTCPLFRRSCEITPFNYHFTCLKQKTSLNSILKQWFTCAGESKCL